MTDPAIVYEDKNFLAVNKPSGLLVHATRHSLKDGESTLVHWLLTRYPEIRNVGDEPEFRPGIVHRLDKETSGLMVVARNQESFAYLKKLFQERQIKKTYLAFLVGHLAPKEGRIEKPIGFKSGSVKRTVHSGKAFKEAVTLYRVRQYLRDISFVEVQPLTGRTHQIRVHLSSTGHPVLGDRLYGRKRGEKSAKRLMLHAFSLEFTTQNGERMRLEAEPPVEFTQAIAEQRED